MTVKTCLVLATCLALIACGRKADAPAASDATPQAADAPHSDDAQTVEIDDAARRDLRLTTRVVESRADGDRVVLLGELGVDQAAYAEVGTPVAARVTRLLKNTGDSVRRGQPLVELTSPDLGKARAEYLSAEARVTLADAALERKRGLAAERIAPLREVQEAESAAAEARAALRAARAAIAAFGAEPVRQGGDEATASTFVLRAPLAGAVIERSAVVGQWLDPASPAFRIGDLSTLWLTVHAFERDAVRLRQGVEARLAFAALPGQDVDGRVTVVGRQVAVDSRTVPIRIAVRNRDGLLRPGMSATASVPVGQGGAPILTIPVASLQRVRGEWCVFVPKDAAHFEIRRVGRGRDLGAEVEVLSGLAAGESIVVDGAFLLKAQAEKANAGHDEH